MSGPRTVTQAAITKAEDTQPAAVLHLATSGEADTRALAGVLAGVLEAGDVIALEGTLGAGKTVFVRGLCEALEVPPSAGVSSPSYALLNHYDGGRLTVAHLDLYRLGGEDALEGIGFRDLLDSDAVVIVEWPERAGSVAEVASFALLIEDAGPTKRRLRLSLWEPETVAPLKARMGPWCVDGAAP